MAVGHPYELIINNKRRQRNSSDLEISEMLVLLQAILDDDRRDELVEFINEYKDSTWKIPDPIIYVMWRFSSIRGLTEARRNLEALHPSLCPTLPSGKFETWQEYVNRVFG